jgi:hypothetical protein
VHWAGYLMLSAKEMTNSLAALPPEALAELGALQASIQAGIEARSLPGEHSVNGLIRPLRSSDQAPERWSVQ